MCDSLIGVMETDRIMLSDSVIEECSELEKVLLTWTDKKLIEGSEFEQGYFESCITEGDLPPVEGASKDNYRFKSIYLKEVNKLIGFFDVYLGYPTRDCVWISIFVIDGTYRKKSYAQEVIKLVAEESKRSGFSKIGIGVYLNNWRALRFWTKAGFDKVKGIYGDGEYQVSKYGLIGLEKYL